MILKNCSVRPVWFPLIIVIILFSSCGSSHQEKKYTIGFSQCTGLDLWRRTMLYEMKTELSLHSNVNFIYADAKGNSKLQIEQVRKMLNSKIDVLIISPNEVHPLAIVVKEAYDKGIPTIIIDRKTSSSQYTAYIGADNYELGRMAANYLGTTFKGNIKVIEVMGLAGSSPAIERERGFRDGIKLFPHIKLKQRLSGNWLKDIAEKRLKARTGSLADINAVFAHNDDMGVGARNVFRTLDGAGKVKIIGVDALPGPGGGMEMVSDRLLTASVVYPTCGKEAVVTAFKILNNEPFVKDNILKSLIVDSNNVELMKMQYSKITSQQVDIEKQQKLIAEQVSIYKSQQIILNIVVISLVLALILGGLVFISSKENRKINISLEAKNFEIQNQRNQLIEMSAKAEAAMEGRLNFFTNISHEFRTPLTLMLSPLSDVLTKEKLTLKAEKNLKLVSQNAHRLLRLVNQLIDYRKIEIDKQKIKATENNIVSYVREIVENFRIHAQQHDIHLFFFTTERKLNVWFDVNMLDKVFFNLIANAIKCSTSQGKVTVKISTNETNHVIVTVEDTGIGMSPEDVALIFDQFYQADNAPINGSGIGLSLSREIVMLHHGNIDVKSQKWKGTSFTITLPLGDSHLDVSEKVTAGADRTINVEELNTYKADLERVSSNTPAITLDFPKDISVLIIEDNADLLNYLQDQLSLHYDVFTAINGNDGLSQAYEKVPDIVISDVVLPGYSGKEITKILKSDFRTSHIPVILLTAQASIDQQISGMNAMADLYISKPFHIDYLLAGISNLLRNRIILKKHFSTDLNSIDKTRTTKTLDKKFLSDLSAIVEQNLANERFSIEDICKLLGISRMQLYRKVKALLDCNISDYILNRRLKKAQFLLSTEDLTISEVTYMVGFSNPNYFATVFKSKYGKTPSEFKKA
ncbi:helix-turn-helix domain-containing protein [Mucilaginibacter limnophilus]|uniref:histidine kinase n=1 Tax=Mucilaginibacter limnophilus TaxID=1932778 RepID=A0A437MTM2_9SPHI|nr:substrate-binding domain-containing protein [Mucilaginibacter limnophilus]RVU01002.1 helix-turn-helix domain-containing protein [Mucilaginibacter limnophilus]